MHRMGELHSALISSMETTPTVELDGLFPLPDAESMGAQQCQMASGMKD